MRVVAHDLLLQELLHALLVVLVLVGLGFGVLYLARDWTLAVVVQMKLALLS